MKKLYTIPEFGIKVTADPETGFGEIVSDLKQINPIRDHDLMLYNAAMDGIESFVLAQACAGIDIVEPAFIKSLRTAIDACANNFLTR